MITEICPCYSRILSVIRETYYALLLNSMCFIKELNGYNSCTPTPENLKVIFHILRLLQVSPIKFYSFESIFCIVHRRLNPQYSAEEAFNLFS